MYRRLRLESNKVRIRIRSCSLSRSFHTSRDLYGRGLFDVTLFYKHCDVVSELVDSVYLYLLY